MVSVRVSLNLKRSWEIFPQETIAVGENCFAPLLNEQEVVELLEHGNTREHKESDEVWYENILQ